MTDDKISILIVDDTPENIDVLVNLLGRDYKIKAASNGKKAIGIANKNPKPDLILLDIMMPDMDGYEVCELLKDSNETKDISIIFQTSNSAPIDEQRAFDLGASDYITKPFDLEVVKSRIKSCVRVIQEKKELEEKILKLNSSQQLQNHEEGLEELIALGETDTAEFKSTLRLNLYTKKYEAKIENQCLKTVVAFLNSKGGVLLVGVDDDGNPLGLKSDAFSNSDKMLLHWHSLLKETIGADFISYIESTIIKYRDKDIMVVNCKPSTRPVFFTRDPDQFFYVRIGNSTHNLKAKEMLAYIDDHYGSAR